jgi:hypothetical protein
MKCPECGSELEYMTVWDGCAMFLCNECLSTWSIPVAQYGNEAALERYYFG